MAAATALANIASFDDWRREARKRLPAFLFDYIDGGSGDEITLARNVDDLRQLKLRQRVMRDVANRSTATELAGRPASLPLALAPIGLAGLMAPRGEVLAARAAAQAGIPFCLSTVGVCAIEEVRAACPEPFWFQLYLMRDRGYARELVLRARAADCSALVLTADLAATGVRRRDQRHAALTGAPMAMQLRRSLQVLSRPGWIRRVALGGRPLLFGNLAAAVPDGRNIEAFKSWVDAQFDASVTWRDVEWLRSLWDGPLIVKGILDADDGRAAAAAGATGVVVSNHGGRQLDGAPSSISALPAVVEAVGDRLEVLVDGGVRSGADLAKALALGAHGAQVGRPWAYAAAVGGQAGVGAMIASLKRELDTTLALMGLDSVAALDRSALVD